MKLLVRREGASFFVKPAVNVPGMNVDFPEMEIKEGEAIYGLTYQECEALADERDTPDFTSPEKPHLRKTKQFFVQESLLAKVFFTYILLLYPAHKIRFLRRNIGN